MAHPNLKKMLATTQATKMRREEQELKVRTLRITKNRLPKHKKEAIELAFIEAKWLYNSILAVGVFDYKASEHGVHSKTKEGQLIERKLTKLHAHAKQNLHKQLQANVKSLASAKKAGRLVGKLKYRSSINSIEYSTGDVRWDGQNKVFVPKMGWLRASGTSQLKGMELANCRLIRQAGQYYLKITCYRSKEKEPQTWANGSVIGLDMGVKTHVTLSDGRIWNSTVEESKRLKGLQRKLARQVKGSNNHAKTKLKLQREYKKMDWLKDELANKLVHSLLADHEFVFFQDEALGEWRPKFGRKLQHSTLGRVKTKLARHPRAVILDKWVLTTQWCPACGSKNKLALKERTYSCSCGHNEQRDVHAAKNMVRFGLANLPPEQREALVEGMSDKISLIEAALQFPLKQATDDASKTRSSRSKTGEASAS